MTKMPATARGDRYREAAKRVREQTRTMTAPDIKEQMEQIARDYERLAKMADRPASGLRTVDR